MKRNSKKATAIGSVNSRNVFRGHVGKVNGPLDLYKVRRASVDEDKITALFLLPFDNTKKK
jgi:hypothetical protein